MTAAAAWDAEAHLRADPDARPDGGAGIALVLGLAARSDYRCDQDRNRLSLRFGP